MRTVAEPFTITSGGPTHVHMVVAVAAGSPPINTVGAPGGRIGPPTCGTTPVTIGQVCMSETRAAGSIRTLSSATYYCLQRKNTTQISLRQSGRLASSRNHPRSHWLGRFKPKRARSHFFDDEPGIFQSTAHIL